MAQPKTVKLSEVGRRKAFTKRTERKLKARIEELEADLAESEHLRERLRTDKHCLERQLKATEAALDATARKLGRVIGLSDFAILTRDHYEQLTKLAQEPRTDFALDT